jgi:hypothetical protein
MKTKAGTEADYAEYKRINHDDPYSNAVVLYGEAWADLMETRMAAGETLEQCAKDASHKADSEGITAFMYGAAASALAHFWEHGEALRRWHNLATQFGNEGEKANETGGVLNPALVTMEGP